MGAFLAIKLAQGADWNKYGFCMRNWETQYANKTDQYPKTLDAAVSVMMTHKLAAKTNVQN